MSNTFIGTGNIGTNPEMRYLQIGDRTAKVLEVRVYFDAYKEDASGQLVQDDGASFWKTVALWDERAERAVKLLRKGARVCVMGRLKGEKWTDKSTGEVKYADHVVADDIYLSLARVEAIQWRERAEERAEEPAGA